MISRVAGTLLEKKENIAVIEVGGVGFKVFIGKQTRAALPDIGGKAVLATHLHVREDGLELYGFSSEADRAFFELLISVSGVGPKSALGVMDVAKREALAAAIKEGRPDLLTKASGIGRKTAERIILDLRTKVEAPASAGTVEKMESDAELLEVLMGLGYKREDARRALEKIPQGTLEDRIKHALTALGKKSRT